MGNTCKSTADSCQCMTKNHYNIVIVISLQLIKINEKKKNIFISWNYFLKCLVLVHMKFFIISRLCFNHLLYNAFLSTHSVYTCEKTRIMKPIKLTNQLSECILRISKKHLFIILTKSMEYTFRIAIFKKNSLDHEPVGSIGQ